MIQTGKAFRESAKHSPENLVNVNAHLRLVLPGALNRYHEALDAIEIEILRAKATIERDLAVCKAQRLRKEHEAAEKDRLAAEELAKQQQASMPVDPQPKDQPSSQEPDRTDQDVTMTDEPLPTKKEENEEGSEPRDVAGTQPQADTEGSDEKPKPTDPLKPEPQESDVAMKAEGENQENSQDAHQNPPDGSAPASAGFDNFSSLFGEPTTGEEYNLDFDLDRPSDAAGNGTTVNHDHLFGDDSRSADTNLPGTSSEDVAVLLPGLENYANATDDFGMVDAPPTSTSVENTSVPAPSPETAAPNKDNNSGDFPPPESNFDDLFFNTGEFGDGTGDQDDMLGEGGEFNDALWDFDRT
ncbi:MAG: hypothetical protein M1819_000374 [Sarea resinae]|nr:MAG: hypothetical protein M1819_000374 [Sarea resinae]